MFFHLYLIGASLLDSICLGHKIHIWSFKGRCQCFFQTDQILQPHQVAGHPTEKVPTMSGVSYSPATLGCCIHSWIHQRKTNHCEALTERRILNKSLNIVQTGRSASKRCLVHASNSTQQIYAMMYQHKQCNQHIKLGASNMANSWPTRWLKDHHFLTRP